MVRNGKFAWEGTYEIDFSGMRRFETNLWQPYILKY